MSTASHSARPHSRTGRLIVIEGIDGAGKTTLSRSVVESLDRSDVVFCSNKQIPAGPPFVGNAMRAIANLLWPKEHTTFDHELPPEYWLYLQSTWYTLLDRFTINPALREGAVVVVDGWFYKFQAKLLARGFQYPFLQSIFAHVSCPDLVVLIDAPVEAIWARKRDFRPHELGLHHRYGELGKQSFIDYQGRIRNHLCDIGRQENWQVLAVSAENSENDSLLQLKKCIEGIVKGRIHR